MQTGLMEADVLEAQLEIAEAQRACAVQIAGYRQELEHALRCCLRLQEDIAILPMSANGASKANEIRRLCMDLEKAALTLKERMRAYPDLVEASKAACRKNVRQQKANIARNICKENEKEKKG